jgi:hypothetical protein
MVIHILVYQNVLKFVNFLKTQSPIGVFFVTQDLDETKGLKNYRTSIWNFSMRFCT